ncbi:MAG: TIGR03936 family radical SAM-associated protein [Lachnospiraceae bacterium]|nr:TIGR03936 family radical SAM-associated protein [Lachnospiraceae bacterium]
MFIRVKFTKTGAIRYIGHLDVMRYFQKCIRRAEIDVAYTGGFSPHQIMTFASPLSVGLESQAEYMDLKLNSLTSLQEIADALNAVSVPEIRIADVGLLPENAGNAMASVAAADYAVEFRTGKVPACLAEGSGQSALDPDKCRAVIDKLLARTEIPYTKVLKKGERILDLRPGILDFHFDEERCALFLRCDASSAGNIKPIQVLESICAMEGETLAQYALLVTRLEMYTRKPAAEGEENGELIPMIGICEEHLA